MYIPFYLPPIEEISSQLPPLAVLTLPSLRDREHQLTPIKEADLDTEVPPYLIRTATGTSYYDIHVLSDARSATPQPSVPTSETPKPASPTPSVLSSINKVLYISFNPAAYTMPMLPSVSNMFGSRPASPAPPKSPTGDDQKTAAPIAAVVDEDGCCFLDAVPSSRPATPISTLKKNIDDEAKEREERERPSIVVIPDDEKKEMDKELKEQKKEEKEQEKKIKEKQKEVDKKQKEIDKKHKEIEKKDKEIDKEIKKEEKEEKRSRRNSNAAPGIEAGSYDDEKKHKSKLPWKKGHQDKGDHHPKRDDDDRRPSAPEIDDGVLDKDGKPRSKLPWKKSRHHEKHKSEDDKKKDAKKAEKEYEKELKHEEKEIKKEEKEIDKEEKKEEKEIKKEEKEIDKEEKKKEKEEEKEIEKEEKELSKEEEEIEKNQEKLEKNIRKEKRRQEKEAKKAKDAEDKERAKEQKKLNKEREEYVKKLEDGEKRAKKGRDEEYYADKAELMKDGRSDHHHLGPVHLHTHKKGGSRDSYDSKNTKKGSRKDRHSNDISHPPYEYKKDGRPKKEHRGLHLPKLGRKKRGSKDSRSFSSSDEFEPKYSKAGKMSDVEAKDRSEYDNQGFYVGVVDSKPSTPVGDDPAGTNWYKKGTIPPPPPNVDVIPFDEGPNKFQGNGGVSEPPNIKGGPNKYQDGHLIGSTDKKADSQPEEKSWIPNPFRRKSPERKPAKERLASETAESDSGSSDDATTEADGRTSIDSQDFAVDRDVAPESIPLPHSSTSLVPTRTSTDKYHIPDRKSGDHHQVRLPILAENPYPHGLQVPSRKLFSDGFHFPPGLELYGITKNEWEEMVHSFNNHINPHRTWWRTAALVWVFWPAAIVSSTLRYHLSEWKSQKIELGGSADKNKVLAYPFKRWGEQHDFNASVEHIMRRVEDADAEIFRPKGLMLRLDKPGEVEGMAYMDMFHRHHVDRLPRAMMVPKKDNGVRTEFPQDLRQAAKHAEQEEDRSVLRHELEGREIARENDKHKAREGNKVSRKASKKRKRSVKHVQRAKERMAKRPRLVIESIKCLEDDRLAEKHGWGVWFRRIRRHTGTDLTDDVVTAKNPTMETFR